MLLTIFKTYRDGNNANMILMELGDFTERISTEALQEKVGELENVLMFYAGREVPMAEGKGVIKKLHS
jgi:hypothetical protein